MTEAPTPADRQLEDVRALTTAATQQLLGATITASDQAWAEPSRLPGWTRAHVATHVARQADALTRLCEWALTGVRQEMYASPEQREDDIERGAGRAGLDLQIDLDTSAGRLGEHFARLDESQAWDAVVELRGGLVVPARLLPVARLLEVTLHHVDLDLGFTMAEVDDQSADWLIEWSAFRLRMRDEFPRLELRSDGGFVCTVGSSGEPRVVSGSSPELLGWLSGRTDGSALQGTGGLVLPAF
ncbi:MAG: hypothetical protein JWP61_766 [Friedmanniella sp.]|nr:hypothetical protein [Friedmanniella sp.]